MRSREVTFTLGYTENPAEHKFDPPGSGRPDTTRARAVIDRYRRAGQVDDDLAALRAAWDERLGDPPGGVRQRARGPDGQHLEPVPVHGHLQPVALGVHVRVGHRPGHGLPGLEPGPARVRPHGPGARPRPDPGHRRDPAARRRRLPPVPAAHEARQPRRGLGVQRRPCVARAGRRGLSQGDGRPLDPRRARPWDNVEGSETPLHDHLRRCIDFTLERLGPARAAAHRAGGLERLSQPQRLLGPARRVLPDGPQPAGWRRRVRVHRRPVRARRTGGGGDRPPGRRRDRGLALRRARPPQ